MTAPAPASASPAPQPPPESPRSTVARWAPFGALIGSLAVYLVVADQPAAAAASNLVFVLLVALMGQSILRRLLGPSASNGMLLVVGAILGLAFFRFLIVAAALAAGPAAMSVMIWVVFATCAAYAVIALRPADAGRIVESPAADPEWRAVAWCISAALLAVTLAYSAVGRATPSGHMLVPYFNLDYLNHVAMVGELRKGVPPVNPYFAGRPLHYYWFFHVWPAALAGASGISAREALGVSLVTNDALFVAALALWLRSWVPALRWRYPAVLTGLFAYSFIGLLVVARMLVPGLGGDKLGESLLSHSWFRDLLYEPHAVMALSLFLAVDLLHREATEPRSEVALGALIGLGFAAMLLSDALVTVVTVVAFGLSNVASLISDSRLRQRLIAAGVVAAAGASLALLLGIAATSSHAFEVRLHAMAKVAPAYLAIDLGPIFLLGLLGFAWRLRDPSVRPLLVLAGVALLVGFTFRMPIEPNMAIRKSLKVLQLPLLAMTGVALERLWSGARPLLGRALAVGLLALGASTLCTDELRYLGVLDFGAPPIQYVADEEMQLLAWTRTHTPAAATVQTVNAERMFGEGTDLLIPAFAERRMPYGNDRFPKLMQIAAEESTARQATLKRIFFATSADELLEAARALGSPLLYVDEGMKGPLEAIQQLEKQGVLVTLARFGRFTLRELAADRPAPPPAP